MADVNHAADETAISLVVFVLGGHPFALPSRDVRELVRAVAVMPLPNAPAIVEGVINARGRIVPVLDIRARFGLPAKALEPSDHMILADAGDRVVALRADRAIDLVQVDARLFDALVGELVVGETYFFRSPAQFEFVRKEVLPSLAAARPAGHVLRAWSAGCASGEELYSLAILLDEEGWGDRMHLLG